MAGEGCGCGCGGVIDIGGGICGGGDMPAPGAGGANESGAPTEGPPVVVVGFILVAFAA